MDPITCRPLACLYVCAALPAGLIQPELLPDGQVCVDMGEPILEGPKVPTTLKPTQVRRLGCACGAAAVLLGGF